MNPIVDGLSQTRKALIAGLGALSCGVLGAIVAPDNFAWAVWIFNAFAFLPISLVFGYDTYIEVIPYVLWSVQYDVPAVVAVSLTALGVSLAGELANCASLILLPSFRAVISEWVSRFQQELDVSSGTRASGHSSLVCLPQATIAWSEYISQLYHFVLLSTASPLRAPPVAA